MKNFLILMSRKRRIMVPVVTLLALTIGISGYYIQNQQILREEEQAKIAEQESSINDDEIKKVEKIDRQDDSDSTDESTSADDSVNTQYVVNVTASLDDNNKVEIEGEIETDAPGSCIISLKNGGFGQEVKVETIGGKCEASLDNPGTGEWTVNVTFRSNEGSGSGSGSTTINL